MSIKSILVDLFNKKKVYQNKKVTVEECDLDISINDEKLLITLGQWMSVLPSSIKTGGNGCYVYSPLSVEAFLKDFRVSEEQKEEIEKRFAYMLSSLGFDDDNVGVLGNFDEENLTFKGEFFRFDYDLDFQITWGSFLDECPQLRITHGTEKFRYNYISAYDGEPDKLKLETYDQEIEEGYTFHHFASEYRYYGDVYNDENRISVEIEYPDSLPSVKCYDNIYLDEVLIQSVLSTTKFPVDIQLLCRRIAEAIKCDPAILPTISITVKKKCKDGKNEQITDKALFKNGAFHEFVITKDGKRVAVDRFDNWSVKNRTFRVAGNAEQNISYKIKEMPVDDYKKLGDIPTLIDTANNEAQEAKGIALTLMQKKKSN